MADWREGKDPKPVRKGSAGKSEASGQPASASFTTASSAPLEATPTRSSDWRGRKGQKSVGASQQTRSEWMRAENAPVVVRGVKRKIFLLCAALALPLLVIGFIRWVYPTPKKLPLLVAVPTVYNSNEFLELPFSTISESQFRSTNDNNIQLLRDSKEASQLLDNILTGEQWQTKYIDEAFKFTGDNSLLGGGPDGNVVALYLSGYVLAEREGKNTNLRLLSTTAKPFSEQDPERSVSLEKALERILQAVAPSSKIWVTLDVRPAPIIANLADLQIPLYEHIKDWHDRLPGDQKDRLIVTLPCDDGQENWLAPELNSSVLAHFYRLCLAGEYDDRSAIKNNSITLQEAQQQINTQVNQWALARRFASQTPRWIMSKSTEDKASKIELVFTNGQKRTPASSPPDSLDGFYKDINRFWEQLRELNEPYRWAPLEYGIAEAQLIHLQDLVEGGTSPRSFNILKQDLTDAIGRLKKRQHRMPPISLIEQALADEYYFSDEHYKARTNPTQLFDKEHNLWLAHAPWPDIKAAVPSTPPPQPAAPKSADGAVVADDAKKAETPAKPEVPSAEMKAQDRDVYCRFMVHTLRQRAASGAEDQWAATFNRPVLRWCLENSQPSHKWLELQFLQILEREVNWKSLEQEEKNWLQSRARHQATALIWKAFCDLQELSSNPRPELAWWLRDAIHQADTHLHAAVDDLIGERYSDALDRIEPLQKRISELQGHSETLLNALDERDRAIWITPHYLGWYLKLYRYTDKPNEVKERLVRLGRIASAAAELSQHLKPEPNQTSPKELGLQESISVSQGKLETIGRVLDQLTTELKLARQDFDAEVKALSELPDNNPQKIRGIRIALRTPLVNGINRTAFSDTIAKFFAQPASDNSTEFANQSKENKERSVEEAVSTFLSGLPRDSNYYHYSELCREDPRFTLLQKLPPSNVADGANARDLVGKLYEYSNTLRSLALIFGAHSTFRQVHNKWHSEWPWSAQSQFFALSRTRASQLQVERLARGWWGDGDLAEISGPSQLYFYSQANQYLTASRADKDSSLSANGCQALIDEMLNNSQTTLDKSAEKWDRAQLSFRENSQVVRVNAKSHPLKFTVQTGPWQVRPSVYLDRDRQPRLASDSVHRTDVLDLSKENARYELLVDQAQLESKPLILAMRGHYRKHPLSIDATQAATDVAISFYRNEAKLPTIRVNHLIEKPAKVIVMLDCSGSMMEPVDDPTRPGQQTSAFTQAKIVTMNILEALGDIRDSHDIDLGLILFGAIVREESFPELGREEQILFSEQFSRADHSFVRKLSQLISDLQPGSTVTLGQTPLYRAVDRAIKMAGTDDSLIYVVSDGFDDERSLKTSTPIDVKQLKKRLGNNHLLHIYQFNNEAYYLKDPERQRSAETLARQRAEVRDLTSGRFVESKSFEELKDEILKALPRSTVSIYSGEQQIAAGVFGKNISIPLDRVKELPLKVRIDAHVGSISKPQRREQDVSLIGDEELNLEFSEQTERLTFIPITDEDVSFKTALAPQSVRKDKLNLNLDIRARMAFNQYAVENSESKLSLDVGLLHQEPLLNYTPRPVLLLARLAEVGQAEDSDYLIADSRIEPQRHYPVIQFPDMQWRRDRSGVPYQANLTMWMAFEKVDFKTPPIELADGEEKRDPQLGATLSRRDLVVTVQVPKARLAEQRTFVVCQQAAQSTRRYSVQEEVETHTFTLFDSVKEPGAKPVTVELITVAQVRDAVSNNKLTEVKFEKVSLSK